MEELNKDAIAQLLLIGKQSAGPHGVDGGNVPYVIDGAGNPRVMPELVYNEHAERPERMKGNVGVLDPESFCEYWRLFADSDSRAFASEPRITVVGVLDYHEVTGSPRWGQHRVILTLQESEQWKVWTAANNKQMTQSGFAEFLEQNAIDIAEPSPANMMEIARDLQSTTEAEFGSGIRQSDGQVKFRYSETVNAKVGAGNLAVPEQFRIELPVFVGGEEISLSALFRFRVKEGHLTMWYTLVRPEEAKRQAFLAARNQIADGLQIKIINGTPA